MTVEERRAILTQKIKLMKDENRSNSEIAQELFLSEDQVIELFEANVTFAGRFSSAHIKNTLDRKKD